MRRLLLAGALLVPGWVRANDFRQPVVGAATVTAYFDLGGVRDWNCNNWTYSGHRGTDIAIIGRFAAQDEGRDAVAAAPGRVIRANDGEFDRCTTGNCGGGGGFGNYVALEHEDGKVTYYGHMRRGSVRVAVGDQVSCGQVLGQVGSSGNSTGPHLHFEVRVGGSADDPFTGPCGGPLTYWVDQGGYRALPASRCAVEEPPPPPPPPPTPDLHLSARADVPEQGRRCDFDTCRDFVRDGQSGGVADTWVGDEVAFRVIVTNQGAGATRGETPNDAAVILAYALPEGWAPLGYLIESDHPNRDRATWARNDAMENPANPPEEGAERTGSLRLNGFSPGESKRVTVRARATERTIAGARPAGLRAWIGHVAGYYGEKSGWDDPVETNDGQTFNGGDLRVAAEVDVFDMRRFLFDAPDDQQLEGWRSCAPGAVGALAIDTAQAALTGEVTDAGPCVESLPIAVDAAEVRGVRLRLRLPAAWREARLQWTTLAQPDFGADREVSLRVDGPELSELHLRPGWTGTITRLRLLPMSDLGAVPADPLRFDLAEVHLTADAPPIIEMDGGRPPPPPPPADGGPLDARGAADGSDQPPGAQADGGEAAFGAPVGAAPGDQGSGSEGARYDGGCQLSALPGRLNGLWAWLILAAARRRRLAPRGAARPAP